MIHISADITIHLHGDQTLILTAIHQLKDTIMASNAELIAQLSDIKAEVDASAAQNAKANAEISAAIGVNTANVAALTQQVADLQAVIAAGNVPQEVIDKVAELKVSADAAKASSQALDDLNPDVPVTP